MHIKIMQVLMCLILVTVSLHPAAKRCCVTSSWSQGMSKCQLTGWSWPPVAPTSVPCSQVSRSVHCCVLVIISYVCVCECLLMCVSLVAGDMSESKAHQVEIREVDGQTLRKLVDYIYTAEIEVTEDNVQVRVCLCYSVYEEGERGGRKWELVKETFPVFTLSFQFFLLSYCHFPFENTVSYNQQHNVFGFCPGSPFTSCSSLFSQLWGSVLNKKHVPAASGTSASNHYFSSSLSHFLCFTVQMMVNQSSSVARSKKLCAHSVSHLVTELPFCSEGNILLLLLSWPFICT